MSPIKASHIALFSILLIAVFLLGFWGGQVSMLSVNDDQVVLNSPTVLGDEFSSETSNKIASNDKDTLQSLTGQSETEANITDANTLADSTQSINSNEISSRFEALKNSPNANALLALLVDIASSENADDMQYFARTMDKLRQLVSEDPSAIQALLDNFVLADADDRSPYYVISVLQGADIPNRMQIFEGLAQQLLADSSNSSQEKFLHLVSSTGLQENNQTISNMLAEIALYSSMETSNRLYALDLLMPYQLDTGQKQTIVDDLKLNINSMEESQRSYAIENLMRFSEPANRETMAREFLSTRNDLSTRVAVLSSLHSGTLQPSSNLKDQLFTIASNTSDPLSSHAKHALMHVFDINKNEYEQLNSGR
jgi:hypothetical protein